MQKAFKTEYKTTLNATRSIYYSTKNHSNSEKHLQLRHTSNKLNGIVFIITLVLMSCSQLINTPEKVLEEYFTNIALCDCEMALELSMGEAREDVQNLIAEGCEESEWEVMSILCEKNDDIATCKINLKKGGIALNKSEKIYSDTYTLTKVGGEWKVLDQWKSINLPEEAISKHHK